MKSSPAASLRPLGTLEILDAACLIVRRHWAHFFATSTLGTLPVALLLMGYFLWLGRLVGAVDPGTFYRGTLIWAFLMTGAWAWNGVARGALTHLSLAVARGEEPDTRDAWKSALRTLPTQLYLALVGFGVIYAAGVFFLAPAAFLLAGWWVARPAAQDEDQTFGGALRRSWHLTHGYRVRSLRLWALSAGVAALALFNLHLLVRFALGTVAEFLGLDFSALLPQLILRNQAYTMFLAAIVFMLLDPLKTVADTLCYLDLRIRREGADLQDRLRRLRGSALVGLLLVLVSAGPARAVTVEEYRTQIRALRAQIHAAPNAGAVSPGATEETAHALIEMPGGQKLSVDNSWVRDGLSGWNTREDKLALLRRLDALERSLGGVSTTSGDGPDAPASPVPSAPLPDPKESLKQILQEPEFQPLADRPELRELLKNVKLTEVGNWWNGFWKWIKDRLFKPAQPKLPDWPNWGNPDLRWVEPVVYILLALLVLYLVVLIIRWLIERPLREEARRAVATASLPPLEASSTENALDHSVDEWEMFAQQWLGRGDVRQAVRALYLATLVHLHRERQIDYNRALTNWIYVRQFRGAGEQQQLLRHLTQIFDEVWYGERPCGEEIYRSFEQGVRALGTPAPLAPAPAGAPRG